MFLLKFLVLKFQEHVDLLHVISGVFGLLLVLDQIRDDLLYILNHVLNGRVHFLFLFTLVVHHQDAVSQLFHFLLLQSVVKCLLLLHTILVIVVLPLQLIELHLVLQLRFFNHLVDLVGTFDSPIGSCRWLEQCLRGVLRLGRDLLNRVYFHDERGG